MQPEMEPSLPGMANVPIWGGVECTCNRVRDRYFDQMELSGHHRRREDFHAIASLGIRTLRFGMLWERYEREGSWHWMDESLSAMQAEQLQPIAGLMHHGSGPTHTSLLDPEFPAKLAAYAGELAERYPWIEAYTPINEPNTTARFSAMYGHWYPHHQSTNSFLRALLNQVKATTLSMQAIRRVRSDVRLIQTDDVGSITGTLRMSQTADLMNLRHWLGFDLLFGTVDREHPMFDYMVREGISEAEILWFRDHPCPPDVIGVNYYVTSDRYLDHRVSLYPQRAGSIEGRFADVEAVRVEGTPEPNFASSMIEAWERYGLPVALTEVHLGGPVDEQIRWLMTAHEGVQEAQSRGVECVALTVWALFGSFFWNQLVTRNNGHYEPGVFDVSTGIDRPTELAEVVAALAAGVPITHPAASKPGWWQVADRACYPWGTRISTAA